MERSRYHIGVMSEAIDRVALQCGCYPIARGVERALGESCDEPGALVSALVRDGYLDSAQVCDAFGYPIVVGAITAEEAGMKTELPECLAMSAECTAKYGAEWAPMAVTISVGSDGVRTPMARPPQRRVMADYREDIVFG
jgi:hypothetical protein